MSARVVFMGGRQAGCVALLALRAAGCDVVHVVAYDEAVRDVASQLAISVGISISDEAARAALRDADLLVSAHGRQIVSNDLLALPRRGGINVHPCLYAYKGPRPVEALMRDDNPRASVGVHRMTSEVDAGEVFVEEFVDVSTATSVDEVYNALYPHYATALLRALPRALAA
jgi:methionyl-tRNA formyltransferase